LVTSTIAKFYTRRRTVSRTVRLEMDVFYYSCISFTRVKSHAGVTTTETTETTTGRRTAPYSEGEKDAVVAKTIYRFIRYEDAGPSKLTGIRVNNPLEWELLLPPQLTHSSFYLLETALTM
jgi:hypothetical protein